MQAHSYPVLYTIFASTAADNQWISQKFNSDSNNANDNEHLINKLK